WPVAEPLPSTTFDDQQWAPSPIAPGDPAIVEAKSETSAVPLAILFPPVGDAGEWRPDIWAVRRDRGAAPPDDFWRWRLGMRPWAVFIAQVLQFQHQLNEDYPARLSGPVP